MLPLNISGSAFKQRMTLQGVLDAMTEELHPKGQALLLRTKLITCRQGANESVCSYIEKLEELAAEAMPDSTLSERRSQVVELVLQHCTDLEFKRAVVMSPATLSLAEMKLMAQKLRWCAGDASVSPATTPSS
mgnify:CR=1 FL=1